eukprot:scaffold286308_cov162-Cyclotella_meneghiniana.AAC.1
MAYALFCEGHSVKSYIACADITSIRFGRHCPLYTTNKPCRRAHRQLYERGSPTRLQRQCHGRRGR